MYFWVPDISLSLLSYYLLAGTRILEEKKEYSVELKRTWVPSILVFCANFNHFESLDLITEHMACRLQTQMVPRFVIVSNSIEKSDFQKDLSISIWSKPSSESIKMIWIPTCIENTCESIYKTIEFLYETYQMFSSIHF